MRGVCGFLVFGLLAASTLSLPAAEPPDANAALLSPSAIARASGGSVADLAAVFNRSPSAPALFRGTAASGVSTPELIRQLDDPSFNVRQAALQQLQRLSRSPGTATILADQLQIHLCDERTSFEVRTQLAELMRHLQSAAPVPPSLASSDVDHLLNLLDDDSFAVRNGAAERLKWLARNPVMMCRLVQTIERRLAEPNLSPSSRQQLEPLWTKIHGAWLLSDAASWNFPPVTAAEIEHWIDQLQSPPDGDHRALVEESASRELLDLMVRPDTSAAVIHALETRLSDPHLDSTAAARLRDLYDWSRPAMAAEYWENRSNEAIQHLLVGVPSTGPGAQAPSYFDHCDDHVAHCVSGNSLIPGDYFVGVAIPHPRQPGAFFRLVNLPTTQRRLAYEFEVQDQSDSRRLAEISSHTLARILAKHEPLEEDDFSLLELLDVDAVSRFAGPYFLAVPDGPHDDFMGIFGPLSRHAVLCHWLASHGTHEAIPGLTEAINQHRITEPDETRPFRMSWVAAMAIAERDSWQGQDAWLAQRIPCADRFELTGASDVGATAAACLLLRHGQNLRDFGLDEVESEPLNRNFHLHCYRFVASTGRSAVLSWWSHQSTLPE